MASSASSAIQQCVSKISENLKHIDKDQMSRFSEDSRGFVDDITRCMTDLQTFSKSDYSLMRQTNDVIFHVRSFRRVVLDCLRCLQKEFEFNEISLDKFLEGNKLTDYKSIFDKEGVCEAHELVDLFQGMDINSLQKDMKPIQFKRLKRKMDEVEKVRNFLEKDMKKKLDEVGMECNKTSAEVNNKLNQAFEELIDVAGTIIRSIEDGKRRAEIRRAVFAAASVGFAILSARSQCALIDKGFRSRRVILFVAGAHLEKYASAEVVSIDKDLKSIEELLKHVKKQTSEWEGHTKQTILNWSALILDFNELLKLMRQGHEKLEDTTLHDVQTHLDDTRNRLEEFDKSLDKFESDIKSAIRS
ncbi:uncharacterized protein [Ptychodera flava]|uniref:uncharacterized protein n=1 Tax=Ptychodera flava TaxID=63121 RepID=UPI00396A3AEA